jgi:hypothetical protein
LNQNPTDPTKNHLKKATVYASSKPKEEPTMVATSTIGINNIEGFAATQADLWEIIHDGRKFLEALEQFATTNFPNDNNNNNDEATTPTNNLQECTGEAQLNSANGGAATGPGPGPGPEPAVKPPYARRKTGQLIQYCAETGAEEGRFDTNREAAKLLAEAAGEPDNVNKHLSRISSVLGGVTRTYMGHYFHYAGSGCPLPEFPIRRYTQHTSFDRFAAAHTSGRIRKRKFEGQIIQYCANTGKEIARFDSQKDAALSAACDIPAGKAKPAFASRICEVLNGVRRSHKGQYFHFADDDRPLPEFPIARSSLHPKYDNEANNTTGAAPGSTTSYTAQRKRKRGSIVQYCANTGKETARFETQLEACQAIAAAANVPAEKAKTSFGSRVGEVLHGVKRTHRGHYYHYTDDDRPLPEFPITKHSPHPKNDFETRNVTGASRTVHKVQRKRKQGSIVQYCAKTGKEIGRFESRLELVHAIAAAADVPPEKAKAAFGPRVCEVLNGQQRTHRGYYYCYADDDLPLPEFPITRYSSHPRNDTTRNKPAAVIAGRAIEELAE